MGRLSRTIANNGPKCFRQHESQQTQENTTVDSQEPEDSLPSQGACDCPSDNWSDSHWDKKPCLENTHIPAAVSTSGDVANHARSNRDRAGATGTLKAPHNDQRRIVLSLRKANARAEKDDKCADVGGAPALYVGDWAPETWC